MATKNHETEWVTISDSRIRYADGHIAVFPRIQRLVAHGITDEKGRQIGGVATIAAHADGSAALNVAPTRNGKRFGALTRSVGCATVDQAKALAAQKFAAQELRYRTKFSRNAVGA